MKPLILCLSFTLALCGVVFDRSSLESEEMDTREPQMSDAVYTLQRLMDRFAQLKEECGHVMDRETNAEFNRREILRETKKLSETDEVWVLLDELENHLTAAEKKCFGVEPVDVARRSGAEPAAESRDGLGSRDGLESRDDGLESREVEVDPAVAAKRAHSIPRSKKPWYQNQGTRAYGKTKGDRYGSLYGYLGRGSSPNRSPFGGITKRGSRHNGRKYWGRKAGSSVYDRLGIVGKRGRKYWGRNGGGSMYSRLAVNRGRLQVLGKRGRLEVLGKRGKTTGSPSQEQEISTAEPKVAPEDEEEVLAVEDTEETATLPKNCPLPELFCDFFKLDGHN